ncbi:MULTISPECIES: carbohydrate kinase family protein [unclassified Sinorhizobium]|uniref:carbohydrate kinase family protein n=1 Tax=unclassified Sinorhizobium TaxID=2613772 RepID=UPI003524B28F
MTDCTFHCLGPLILDRIVEVDRLPGQGEKAFVQAKRVAPGGPSRNVAVSLARWGNKVDFHSRVGDDASGRMLIDNLATEGIATSGVDMAKSMETTTSLVIVERSGETAILIDPIEERWLQSIGGNLGVETGDVVIANFFHPGAVSTAFAKAGRKSAMTVLDIELPEIVRYGWEAALSTGRMADLVVTNAQVIGAFIDQTGFQGSPEMAATHFARQLSGIGRLVCVTLGSAGVVARDGDQIISIPAMKVAAKNTTGAGDVFLAAFVRAHTNGIGLAHALRLATAAAGLFVAGDFPSWPEVELLGRSLSD